MNTGLDQYMDIFKDAVEDSDAKLTKSFEKILIDVIILFMVIPRKINFTQMRRYGSHVEQTYRNTFGLKKSKSIDWLKLNVSLAKHFFGKQGRWAIAIDPSYISKAGKKTPHIGRFWSGCAQSVKHGLEIMGIGLIDIDTLLRRQGMAGAGIHYLMVAPKYFTNLIFFPSMRTGLFQSPPRMRMVVFLPAGMASTAS